MEKLTSEINWQAGDVAKVKEGWFEVGDIYEVLGPAVFVEQWWVPIISPKEEDPTFFKENGLIRIKQHP